MSKDTSSPEASERDASRTRPAGARRGRLRLALMIVVPLVAALAGVVIYLMTGRYVETDNAYVKADKVPVSAEVSGTIAQVRVKENETVGSGQVLFRIDSAPFALAVTRAEAKLARVRTDLAALKASYREKRAEIALADTRLEFARKEQRRQADLVKKKFVSASSFDDASRAADLAGQEVTALKEDLARIAESLGGSADVPVEAHPNYREALAELDEARLDLQRTEVRAALPGTVSKVPKPGQYVAAGSAAMVLVVSETPWVEANFTETDLTYVRPGQSVEVRVDTFPGQKWKGVVDSLSPATGAEFSVIPAQNATGNWVKVTQRVPVRIRIDPDPDQPRLLAGLSAVVEIDTGHRRSLFGLSL